ncbi:sugar ABC transporter ATP-binding protein [Marinihelvus fidelis]|uniref:Sugar ABC transporter ATP-binding protein n=1 Tax=Marinihelvus fidelis TaxID=2613842 RepID=A0A5N0T7R3_9GAMM|nr:sugar ABC transporter ATP-binding protein [Marinihelvus fidelis]KAA9131043.1 sugar ABC transporter ATP-binding protein [Marinihelvus fidelis]
MTAPGDIVLQAQGISKSFPGVKALDDVGLTLRSGRLTALLGENGAGKSTLMNIIAGVLRRDTGTIHLGGEPVDFGNPREASEAGITMIFQELNLVANLTIAQNIFLGREPLTRLGLIDTAKMNRDAAALLETLDLDVPPTTPVSQLRVGQQQVVEIAKALSTNARVLIMDEPTSAITEHEIEVLFGIIDRLKRQGVAIAYITHKLEELTRIGDDAVVMRDGRLIDAAPLADLDRDGIVRMMVGRESRQPDALPRPTPGAEVLRAENISLGKPGDQGRRLLDSVSFDVREGEVLGIFGLMGAGRTELLETVFGLHPGLGDGQLLVDGEPASVRSPADAIAHGLALGPEDRKHEGLVLGMSVADNTSLASLPRFTRRGFIDRRAELAMVDESNRRFRVKTPSSHEIIRNLSGGNQQKVILGKWLATQPRVLLLDEPTRGIDINAKEEIYALINELSHAGLAVIVVSSELPEVLAIADRVMVLCEGRKTAEFSRAEANEANLMNAALPTTMESLH